TQAHLPSRCDDQSLGILCADVEKTRGEIIVPPAGARLRSKGFNRCSRLVTGLNAWNFWNHWNDWNELPSWSLAVNRQKREHPGRVEDAGHRNQIVIGVLEADVARAVVDRLNAAKIEKAGVVGRGRKREPGLVAEHGANAVLERLHDFGVFADFARIHEIARLDRDLEGIDFADRVFHLADRPGRIVARQEPPV